MTIPTREVTLVDVYNFCIGKGKFSQGVDLSQHLKAELHRYEHMGGDDAVTCFRDRRPAFEACKAGNVKGMALGLGLEWPLYIPPTDKEVVAWALGVIGTANTHFSNGGPGEALAKDELKALEADLQAHLNRT